MYVSVDVFFGFAAFARLPLLMELLGAPKSLEKCIISPLINQLA